MIGKVRLMKSALREISRIHRIDYSVNVTRSQVRANEMRVSTCLDGLSTLYLYESKSPDGGLEPLLVIYQTGGATRQMTGEQFFAEMDDPGHSLSGDPVVSKHVLGMGWLPWADEYEPPDGLELAVVSGHDCSGELNVLSLDIDFEAGSVIAVIRNVYHGRIDQDVLGPEGGVPDGFNVDDGLELVACLYRPRREERPG